MGEHQYLHSEMKDEEEIERLRIQESIIDPITIRHLETIGVSEGWKCLEVGAGAGSIVQWLLQRVGPTGRVVATDIDLRFLHRIKALNLETRRHDIAKDELEGGVYDLVHCRKLLVHLREPEKAMKKMADALRPGGWILAEEDDYGSVLSMNVTDSSLTQLVTLVRGIHESLRKKGIVDVYFGRRVRSLVEGAGFVDVGQEGWTSIVRGGDPQTLVEKGNIQAMFQAGVLTKVQYDILKRMSQDVTLYYPNYTLFCAWGRKPAHGGGI